MCTASPERSNGSAMMYTRKDDIATAKDEWQTPDGLFQKLNDEFNFNCDAAATAANAQVDLMVNPLVLNGTLLLSNTNSILNSNSINVTIKGDLTNNGSTASYLFGTNLTTFNGNTQNLNGTAATNFYDLTVVL